jgi:hypothetical protein
MIRCRVTIRALVDHDDVQISMSSTRLRRRAATSEPSRSVCAP